MFFIFLLLSIQASTSTSTNIVNRCADAGVQIEISRKLRDQLRADLAAREKFAAAVRLALKQYSAKPENL